MAKKITLTYLFVGVAWILVSDTLFGGWLSSYYDHEEQELMVNIIKGLLYVMVTAAILYAYLRTQFHIRKKADEEFRHLFDDNPNPMLVCTNAGAIEAANDAAAALYGYTRTELIGMAFHNLFIQYGPSSLKQSTWGEVQEHRAKDGRSLSLRVHVRETNFHGANSWLLLLVDMNEERLMRNQNETLHKQVYQNERYLHSLIEAQTTYLIRTDLKGRFSFRNKAFLTLFGNSQGIQQPDNLYNMIESPEVKKLAALFKQCVASPGKNYSTLLQLSLVSSLNRITEWEFIAIRSEDDIIEIQGVGKDVTDKLQYLEQLSSYKEQLESILRTVNDVVWSVDAQTYQIRYLNAAVLKIYGRSPEEFYENSALWFDMITKEDRPRMAEHTSYIKSVGAGEIEYRIVRADGSVRHLRDRSVLVRDDKGQPRTINGIATDITELRHSQEDVRKINDQINTILETMNDAFYSLDDQLRITAVNKSFEKMMSRSREELIGTPIRQWFVETNETVYQPLFERALKNGKVIEERIFDHHLKKWLEMAIYPVQSDLAVFSIDRTENHLLQQALEKEQRNLEGLINNTADPIWSVDRQLKLITANEAFKNRFKLLFGFRPEEGQLVLLERQDTDKYREWETAYQRALTGEAFRIVMERVIKGRTHFNEVSFYPIRGEHNHITSIGCYGKDITEKMEKDLRIQKQNEQLMEIAWIESHKLRAPLANILGLIELLEINPGQAERADLYEKLQHSGQVLDEVIREVVERANAVSYLQKH